MANDGFHEAAGRSQLPDDAWVPGIGHVRPQRGLQVNPGEGEFGLQEGTDIAFIANNQTLNPIRQIPQRLAMELALTGEFVSAQRAYEMGLINRIVDGVALEGALQLAEAISANGPLGKNR